MQAVCHPTFNSMQVMSESEIDEVSGGNVQAAIRMVAVGAAVCGVGGAVIGAGVAYVVFFM